MHALSAGSLVLQGMKELNIKDKDEEAGSSKAAQNAATAEVRRSQCARAAAHTAPIRETFVYAHALLFNCRFLRVA